VKATIWHNPRCTTSRKTLAILQETPELAVEVIEYLVTPPTRERLVELYAKAGITPRQGLRAGEEAAVPYRDADDDTLLDAMVAQPILIQRPLVETPKGVRLCRPIETVREIL
jgi:arsenate reductase